MARVDDPARVGDAAGGDDRSDALQRPPVIGRFAVRLSVPSTVLVPPGSVMKCSASNVPAMLRVPPLCVKFPFMLNVSPAPTFTVPVFTMFFWISERPAPSMLSVPTLVI